MLDQLTTAQVEQEPTEEGDELLAHLKRLSLTLEVGRMLHHYHGSRLTESVQRFIAATA